MKYLNCSLCILLWLMAMPSVAKTDAEEAAAKSLTAITIFMDVNQLTRKNLAAKKMTKHHNQFAAVGFELVSVNPYIENGDLEGFFISYQKK